jgi:hypothetical protein
MWAFSAIVNLVLEDKEMKGGSLMEENFKYTST